MTVENELSEVEIKPVIKVNKELKLVTNINAPAKVMEGPRISRALLTKGVNNREPLGIVNPPLIISKKKHTRVYYYTEIMGMKGESLFHQWFWNEQLIYKKEIKILGNRWRASTGKRIPYSKPGVWKAKLVNKKGAILNEIQFKVIQE